VTEFFGWKSANFFLKTHHFFKVTIFLYKGYKGCFELDDFETKKVFLKIDKVSVKAKIIFLNTTYPTKNWKCFNLKVAGYYKLRKSTKHDRAISNFVEEFNMKSSQNSY
jgi:hypothetical protein